MPKLLGKFWTKKELLAYIGDPLQIAGAIPSILADGKADGVKAVHIRTGSGLEYYVLPGRGLDIPLASYNGNAINFFSGTGITSPMYYEEAGLGWLRSFNVGLLTTCGIGYSGMPNTDSGLELGLHGRVANAGAENVSIQQRWIDDEYVISIQGKIRESSAMFENLSLTRTIESRMGSSKIVIHDVVENHSFESQPIMMLYHINFGFPFLSPDSKLIIPSHHIESRDAHSQADKGIEKSKSFCFPQSGYQEKAYFHFPKCSDDGVIKVGIINPNSSGENGMPLGVVITYNNNQLPYLFEWKMMREGFYTCGIEPGMAHPLGRKEIRDKKQLFLLEGQDTYTIDLEIDVLETVEERNAFISWIQDITPDK
jgi:uncharacterized protein DUF4432